MSKMAILDLCSSVGALQYGNRCLTHVAAFFPSVLPAARRRPEFGGPLCPTCVSAACERSKVHVALIIYMNDLNYNIGRRCTKNIQSTRQSVLWPIPLLCYEQGN